MEEQLIQIMVACLTSHEEVATTRGGYLRVPVMRRFEQVLDEKEGDPLYLEEVCAEIGVTGRTLRLHCQEHLGMGPHHYLWLRRMHLAQRVLARADPGSTTVTVVANDHGFGELGRFAIAYRKQFGESPSITLRCQPDASGGSKPHGPRLAMLPILP